MKIDFDSTINDLNGKPVMQGEKPLDLRDLAVNSLMAVLDDERHLNGDEKMARFTLAMKVKDGGEVDLTPEEVSKLKALIGKCYSALAVGRAYEILNG